MSLLKKVDGIRSIMLGAVLTGISLVIANTWGEAIKSTVTKIVDKIRCGHLLVLKDQGKYEKCQKNNIYTLYINAFITTILLSLVAFFLFGQGAVKKMKAS